MFGKVKKLLGIEGVKLMLDVPYEVDNNDTSLFGEIVLLSMNEQEVHDIHLKLMERYKRGRRKNKLTDEYKLTELYIEGPWTILPEEELRIPFSLRFDLIKSDMDRFANRNFLFAGLAGIAKKIKGVKSEYRLEATAKAEGTVLDPFDKKIIKIR